MDSMIMNDRHVHVTGPPIYDGNKKVVKEKLEESLKANQVDSFSGIISPGSLYTSAEVKNWQYYRFFDIDGFGLGVVRDLGGTPVVRLQLSIQNLDDVFKRMQDEGINHAKLVLFEGEQGIDSLVNDCYDIGVETILVHVPPNFEVIKPVFEPAYKKGIQLILGHGCYKSKEFVEQVKDYGFLVDTSNHSLDNIIFWIDNGAKVNVVLGSDWPANPGGFVDWNKQETEINKLKGNEKTYYLIR